MENAKTQRILFTRVKCTFYVKKFDQWMRGCSQLFTQSNLFIIHEWNPISEPLDSVKSVKLFDR
jgi:hypothetical protein